MKKLLNLLLGLTLLFVVSLFVIDPGPDQESQAFDDQIESFEGVSLSVADAVFEDISPGKIYTYLVATFPDSKTEVVSRINVKNHLGKIVARHEINALKAFSYNNKDDLPYWRS